MTDQDIAAVKPEQADHYIHNLWTLQQYLTWLNQKDDVWALATDLEHWAGYGITTAPQLAEYLDSCVAKELDGDWK